MLHTRGVLSLVLLGAGGARCCCCPWCHAGPHALPTLQEGCGFGRALLPLTASRLLSATLCAAGLHVLCPSLLLGAVLCATHAFLVLCSPAPVAQIPLAPFFIRLVLGLLSVSFIPLAEDFISSPRIK